MPVVFRDESLSCLRIAVSIGRNLEARNILFNFTREWLGVYILSTDHVTLVSCQIPSVAFWHYPITGTRSIFLDKGRCCDFIDDLDAACRSVTFKMAPSHVKLVAGAQRLKLSIVQDPVDDVDMLINLSFMIPSTLESSTARDICTFSLTKTAFRDIVRTANALHANFIMERAPTEPTTGPSQDSPCPYVWIEGREDKGEIEFMLSGETPDRVHRAPEPVKSFHLGDRDIFIHRMSGTSGGKYDARYFRYIAGVDALTPASEGGNVAPFTAILGLDKPLVLQVGLELSRVDFVIAPAVPEIIRDEDDGNDGNDGGPPDFDPGPALLKKARGFIEDEYFNVNPREFVKHVGKYIDMDEWELRTISRVKHLVSKRPMVAKFENIRGCISLEDASFSLYDAASRRKFKTVACRHLVLQETVGRDGEPLRAGIIGFQQLPLVQSVIATANTCTLGSYMSFSPRILIDSIEGRFPEKQLAVEILQELVLNMSESYDKYQRVYYLSYILYLFKRLGSRILDRIRSEPWDDQYQRIGAWFLPGWAGRGKMAEHFPQACFDMLGVAARDDPSLLAETYTTFLVSKETMRGFLDIAEDPEFMEDSFQRTFLEAVMIQNEAALVEQPGAPTSLSQAARLVTAGKVDQLDAFLLYLYYELENALIIIMHAAKVPKGVYRDAIFRHFKGKANSVAEWVGELDALASKVIARAASRVERALVQLDAVKLYLHVDGGLVKASRSPLVILPFLDMYKGFPGIDGNLRDAEARSALDVLRKVVVAVIGDNLAKIIDSRK